jgi:hypothetical protein
MAECWSFWYNVYLLYKVVLFFLLVMNDKQNSMLAHYYTTSLPVKENAM